MGNMTHLLLYAIVGGLVYALFLLKIHIHVLLAAYNGEHGEEGYS